MLDELSGHIRNFVSKDLYFFFPFLSPIQSQIHKKNYLSWSEHADRACQKITVCYFKINE